MTASELKKWLEGEASTSSGWSKDDGSGESVGHESGRKIVAILEKNPKRDPSKYDEEDIPHMRKVVAYSKSPRECYAPISADWIQTSVTWRRRKRQSRTPSPRAQSH